MHRRVISDFVKTTKKAISEGFRETGGRQVEEKRWETDRRETDRRRRHARERRDKGD